MKTKYFLPLAALVIGTLSLSATSSDPKLVDGAMPDYPEVARTSGAQGTVVVEALVDESGRVFAAEVVQSSDENLATATLAAVRQWTFSPAMEDGKAVMKVVRIPIVYNLIDPVKNTVLQAQDQAIASR